MEHIILYKDAGAYSCFPAIARSSTNRLWVTFRRAGGFSLKAVQEGKYDHVDKGARIGLLHSDDDGRTWPEARIFPAFDPERGEQDPSVQALADGSLMINFFQWFVVPEAEKERLKYPARQQIDGSWADVEGPFVIRSFNRGMTWESSPVYVDSSPLPRAGTSDAVVELADGALMMGIYGADPGSGVCRSYSVISRDRGQTWGEPQSIAADPHGKISFEEPAICRTAAGSLIAMIRAGQPGKYQYLYQAFSDDNGRSWTGLAETPLWGHPAHVLKLADGRLLCSYGYRRAPYGIRACTSRDNGMTWDMQYEYVLRDDGASRDLGYPCSVQLSDGSILTVYYIHTDDGIRHIAGTRWEVRP
jgi:hypothetical protein